MKEFFRLLWQRYKLYLPTILVTILCLSIYGISARHDYSNFIVFIFIILTITVPVLVAIVTSIAELISNSKNQFEKLLIGKTFWDFSKKSRMFNKAVSSLNNNDFNTALDIFCDLHNYEMQDSWKAVLSYFHGRTYQLMGYPTNAAKYYSESIQHGINIDDVYILAGRCYSYNGSFHEAIEIYNALLKRNTIIDYVLTDMGLTYLKKGEPQNALNCFLKSINEGKNYTFSLGGCSLSYLQMKEIDLSKEYYERALINNMEDLNGFKKYYCKIAEAVGCYDKIDEAMKHTNFEQEDYSDVADAEYEY